MSACPSRLELSRWEAESPSERPADVTSHVESCVRCGAIWEELCTSRSLLLGTDPVEISRRAARAIVTEVRKRRQRRRWWQLAAPAFLVPAAAALVLALSPGVLTRPGSKASGIETKGGLIVETYCKRGSQVFVAADGQEFLEGDRLRFAYTHDRPGYLSVFGVDDQARIFPYYEEETLAGFHAEAGARILLPGSVELDEHHGWERIFALWSDSELRDDAVRAAVAAALSAAENDIRRVTALDLPVEQVSILLRRP
jgi:hypothetical protein